MCTELMVIIGGVSAHHDKGCKIFEEFDSTEEDSNVNALWCVTLLYTEYMRALDYESSCL